VLCFSGPASAGSPGQFPPAELAQRARCRAEPEPLVVRPDHLGEEGRGGVKEHVGVGVAGRDVQDHAGDTGAELPGAVGDLPGGQPGQGLQEPALALPGPSHDADVESRPAQPGKDALQCGLFPRHPVGQLAQRDAPRDQLLPGVVLDPGKQIDPNPVKVFERRSYIGEFGTEFSGSCGDTGTLSVDFRDFLGPSPRILRHQNPISRLSATGRMVLHIPARLSSRQENAEQNDLAPVPLPRDPITPSRYCVTDRNTTVRSGQKELKWNYGR
jgi:hypothetical protein